MARSKSRVGVDTEIWQGEAKRLVKVHVSFSCMADYYIWPSMMDSKSNKYGEASDTLERMFIIQRD